MGLVAQYSLGIFCSRYCIYLVTVLWRIKGRNLIRVVSCRTVLLVNAHVSLLVVKHTLTSTPLSLPVMLYVPHVLWPVVSSRVLNSFFL